MYKKIVMFGMVMALALPVLARAEDQQASKPRGVARIDTQIQKMKKTKETILKREDSLDKEIQKVNEDPNSSQLEMLNKRKESLAKGAAVIDEIIALLEKQNESVTNNAPKEQRAEINRQLKLKKTELEELHRQWRLSKAGKPRKSSPAKRSDDTGSDPKK